MSRPARAAALGAACSLIALRVSLAQVSVTLDVGASRVAYDGFLPSAAVAVSPALRVASNAASVTARGTWLGFESGNTSVQGLLAGSVFSRAHGSWRGELAATAGASSYEGLASFAHVLARARLHFLRPGGGAWLAATLGRASYDASGHGVTAAAAGAWRGTRDLNVTLAVSGTQVADTAYADIEASGYWQRGRLELEGSMGARGGHGGGHGVYGEAIATLNLSRSLATTLGFGRYPTDPIRGSVSGRYVSLGVRVTGFTPTQTPRVAPAGSQPPVVAMAGTNGHLATATITVAVEATIAVLVIHAPGAATVEVMGDFTDWEPVALTRFGDSWRLATAIPSGLRRLNVRVDGGDWSVPLGATLEHDEFGTAIGTIVVP